MKEHHFIIIIIITFMEILLMILLAMRKRKRKKNIKYTTDVRSVISAQHFPEVIWESNFRLVV